MSSLPNSKTPSSFARAAQGCGALVLAGTMVLPMSPALAHNVVADAPAAVASGSLPADPAPKVKGHQKPEPKPDPKPVEQTTTFEVSVPNGYKYDGVNTFLVTTEGGIVHVKGSGYTKEWRAQHGTVALYIAPANYAPSGYRIPTSDMLRFVEGKDFTIADDGTFEADLKVKAYKLAAYYFIDDDIFHDPTGGTKYDVRYEIHVVAEQKGQKPLTAEELWTSKNVVHTQVLNTLGEKAAPFAPRLSYNAVGNSAQAQVLDVGAQGFNGNINSVKGVQFVVREKGSNTPVLATSDIIEFNHPTQAWAYRDGNLNGTVNLPANTLNASKKYVIEVWANDGYSESGELLAPVVGKSTEGRGTLLAWQDLDLNGTNGYKDANLPTAQDNDKKPDPAPQPTPKPEPKPQPTPKPDQSQLQQATRGELTAALYVQAGTPEVKLPKTSPWPDVKTTDPNFPAYVWARQKSITFGWSDGKFHAEAGVSNATVAAFAYRAVGSPAVTGTSSYKDVTPGSAFYREILWAQQNKVVLNASGVFDAQHMVTRAELATLIAAYQAR